MSLFRPIPRVLNLQAPRSGILGTGIPPLRNFTTTPPQSAKPLPPRLKLLDSDLSISYLKGTGPGGQKIVSLHHISPLSNAKNPIIYNALVDEEV